MGTKEKRGIKILIIDGDDNTIIEDSAECVIIKDRNILFLEKGMVRDEVNKWEMEMKNEYAVYIKKR